MRSPRRLSSLLQHHRVHTAVGILGGLALTAVLAPVLLFVVVVMLEVFHYSRAWP